MKKIKNYRYAANNEQNSVYFDDDIHLNYRRPEKRNFILFRFIVSFATLFSVSYIFSCFINDAKLKYSFHISPVFLLFYSIFLTFSFGITVSKQKHIKIIGLILSFANILYLLFHAKDIKIGFYVCTSRYFSRANLSYSASILKRIPSSDYLKYSMVFFMLLMTIISFIIVISFIYYLEFSTIFVSTFPFVELGLYWGWEAPLPAFILLLCCWVIILSLGLIDNTTNKAGIKNTFAIHEKKRTFYFTSQKEKNRFYPILIKFIASLCAFVFILEFILSSIVGSTRPKSFDKYRRDISNGFENFSVQNIKKVYDDVNLWGIKSVGGTNGGILGKTSGIEFNDSTALTLKLPAFNETIYLKGYIGGEYKDNRWYPLDINADTVDFDDDFSAQNLYVQDLNYVYAVSKAFSTPIKRNNIDITVKSASKKFAYAPYYSLYSSDKPSQKQKSEPTLESFVKLGRTNYSLEFLGEPIGSSVDSVMMLAEKNSKLDSKVKKAADKYKDFVYQNYTTYYDSDALKQAYEKISDMLDDNYNYKDVYTAIKIYFNQNYTYDLNPGITPDDKDFIDYFMTKQKKGYCTYFATVGTQLLRMFGFPARYAEGYFIVPKQLDISDDDDESKIYTLDIKDRSAHAWAEVYIDDVGWVPAEFTPGYGQTNPNLKTSTESKTDTNSSSIDSSSLSAGLNSSSSVSENSSPENNVSGSSAENSYNKDSSALSNDIDNSSKNIQNNALPNSSSPPKSIFKTILKYILILIILIFTICCLVLFRKFKADKIKSRCTQGNTNDCAKWIYRYTLKYISLLGINTKCNMTDTELCKYILKQLDNIGIEDCNDKLNKLCDIALKADLSGLKTSPEDIKTAYKIMDFFAYEIVMSKLNLYQKLYAKYILCIY